MVSVIVRYLFYQPMDEKVKTWPFHFPAQKNLIWRRHWSIGQSCCSWLQDDVKAKYRLISRKFSGMKCFLPECSINQTKATRVCIRSINQSNRFISVRLFFLFCSRVFISRPYENRSNPLQAQNLLTNSPH